MALMTRMDVGPVINAPVFDIRNGDVTTARNVYVRPTIPEGFRWVPIEGLPAANAIAHTAAFIRSAHGQIETHPPAGMSEEARRKVAIILGVSRAVMTSYFQIATTDLIPGEHAGAVYRYGRDAAGVAEVTVAANAIANKRDFAQAMTELTEAEKTVVSVLMTTAIGALPLQGFSLIMTGHHYLSEKDSQSRRAYDVVERQFWKSQSVRDWFNADAEVIRDAAWHKAGHPVSITLKECIARDDRVAEMLKVAGVGSAASRLPAIEPEIRCLNSYKTLMATVRPLFQAYGGDVDYTTITDLDSLLACYPVSSVAGAPAAAVPAGFVLPPDVYDRTSAIKFIKKTCDANSGVVAFCYGFYTALTEQSMMLGAAAGADTLKASYSLAKLRNQSHASYIAGAEAYRDYSAYKQSKRQAGEFQPPVLSTV